MSLRPAEGLQNPWKENKGPRGRKAKSMRKEIKAARKESKTGRTARIEIFQGLKRSTRAFGSDLDRGLKRGSVSNSVAAKGEARA
jgi:hypothetical protein